MDPMAPRRIEMLLSMSLAVALCGVTMGQTQSDCTDVIISLSPCLDYVTGNASAPSSDCCSQLASVAMSQPHCLCEVVNGGASSVGLNINQTRALALPSDCRVQTPPVSSCSASSPTGAPAAVTPDSPSESGSNIVPSRSGDSASGGRSSSQSQGNSTKLPSSLLILFLLVTSLTFTISTTSSPIWPHIF